MGAQVLTRLGATLERVRDQVMTLLSDVGVSQSEVLLEERSGPEGARGTSLSPRIRAAMVLAEEIAQKYGHSQIEPEDLLRVLFSLALGDPRTRDILEA